MGISEEEERKEGPGDIFQIISSEFFKINHRNQTTNPGSSENIIRVNNKNPSLGIPYSERNSSRKKTSYLKKIWIRITRNKKAEETGIKYLKHWLKKPTKLEFCF